MRIIKNIILISIFTFITGCSNISPSIPPPLIQCENCPPPYKIYNTWYQPISPSAALNFRQKGIASWYGDDFHGKKTSNGETYNMYDMTAAHKTLPFDSIVEVKNLLNDKKIIVRINDRGPFIGDRIIDLSYTAAQKLAMVKPGTAPVEISVLAVNKENLIAELKKEKVFCVQAGAFKNLENAREHKAFLSEKYNEKVIITEAVQEDSIYYKVKVIGFKTLEEAKKYALELIEIGIHGVFILIQ